MISCKVILFLVMTESCCPLSHGWSSGLVNSIAYISAHAFCLCVMSSNQKVI